MTAQKKRNFLVIALPVLKPLNVTTAGAVADDGTVTGVL